MKIYSFERQNVFPLVRIFSIIIVLGWTRITHSQSSYIPCEMNSLNLTTVFQLLGPEKIFKPYCNATIIIKTIEINSPIILLYIVDWPATQNSILIRTKIHTFSPELQYLNRSISRGPTCEVILQRNSIFLLCS